MTHLSLFSGIGGIDLAAEWAGFRTVAFVEKDPFCQKVLAKHWPEVPIHDDITKFDGAAFRGVFLVSGGFPCQPFSHAGKRRGKEDDRHLWPEMLRVVEEARPTWVLGENVAGFVGMALDLCLSDLDRAGYETEAAVLPALAVGAPHRRERCFVLAHSRHTESPGRNEAQGSREGAAQPKSPSCGNAVAHTRCSLLQGGVRGTETITAQWLIEPAVGRVAHGVSNRVDRLRALGNAVVPQQVYPILKEIADQIQQAAAVSTKPQTTAEPTKEPNSIQKGKENGTKD